jgi:hypothetical protein
MVIQMTSKAACHSELWESSVQEWVQNKTINVQHVSGKISPADIFTREMRDSAHFRRIRDSFMSRLSNFINDSLLVIHHTNQQSPKQFVPSAAKAMLTVHPSSYFSALASSSLCRTFTAISHLCSAGCQLVLRNVHGVCSTTSYIAVVPLIILVRSGCCPSFPLSWLLPKIYPSGIYLP